ncbi:MAG: NMD3-related protein [Candidatus Hodarchaeota archaeon]
MPQRFCAICGKDLDEHSPHFGMCLSCYLEEHPLFEIPPSFSFRVCPDCGKYSKKEEWFEINGENLFGTIEEAIQRFLLKSYLKQNMIEFTFLFDEDSFQYSSKDLLSSLSLTIKGNMKEYPELSHEKIIKININYDLCRNCGNLRGGTYFLSILQLRVNDQNQFDLVDAVLEDVQDYVEKLFEKDEKHYISKVQDEKYGVDLFLSTNELMNHIISHLKTRYHFILKRSKKLIGRDIQKGKNLYRLKALIKILPIQKNDNIQIGNRDYFIEGITKNKVILRGEDNAKTVKDFTYIFNQKIIIKKSSEKL